MKQGQTGGKESGRQWKERKSVRDRTGGQRRTRRGFNGDQEMDKDAMDERGEGALLWLFIFILCCIEMMFCKMEM